MVLFNYSTKEITAKVVFYGPGLCGKTTNLQYIYDNLPSSIQRGRMLSLATKTDRTLFFDFLPIDLGTIRGMKTRVQLYTVPGQVFYNSTRKLVLKGADGLVFVADSQEKMSEANQESFRNLEENCIENGINLSETALVLQFNKRDLPGISSVEEMNNQLNKYNAPFYESVATTGIGVHETLKAITKLVLHSLREKYAADRRPAASRPAPAARPKAPAAAAPPAEPAAAAEQPIRLEQEVAPAASVAAPAPPSPPAEEPIQLVEEAEPPASPAPKPSAEEPAVVEEAAPGSVIEGGALEAAFAEMETEKETVEELTLEEEAPAPAPEAAPPVVEGLLGLAEEEAPAGGDPAESFADLAAEFAEPAAPQPPPAEPVVALAGAPIGIEDDDPLGLGPEAPAPPAATAAPVVLVEPGQEEVDIPLEVRTGDQVHRVRLRLRISLIQED